MDANSSLVATNHVVLFPFMSKGHTIPILNLARLLLRRRGITVTVFTTPGNLPFVSNSLSDTDASIIPLPFPQNIPGIPSGVESTDKLPSVSLFVPFCWATKQMQPDFERELQSLPPVSFMVSDGFLWWTPASASKFGFPRLVFYGLSGYAYSVSRVVREHLLLLGSESEDELITVTPFPWIGITKRDFEPTFLNPEHKGAGLELFMDQVLSTSNSYGIIVNSFYEMEQTFVDYCNQKDQFKLWCVGPLCLAKPIKLAKNEPKPSWIQWLDGKLEAGCSVLYVAFGSQADISAEQLKEIAKGLEESKVNFLWVIRKTESELGDGFEERVKNRGIVVREWVDQWEILMHQSVQGFLSHCGLNSVLESICAAVPILAWPMIAEQPLNARMVSEEIKVGLRVDMCDGKVRGFVKSEGLKKMVKELMEGETGNEVRKKVKEVAEMANKALKEGSGSSWLTLDLLIKELGNKN
ncbi:hypothetical protein SLA2020_375900 [Shorea laevis]